MKIAKFVVLALISITLATSALAEITYDGSSTIGENILPEATKLFTQKTGIIFSSIKNNGSGIGIKSLLAKKCDIAGISRAPKAEEKKEDLKFHVIGNDAIAVIVNKANPVKSLTKAQIADIFSGKIRNWKDVGGKDGPIIPVIEILVMKRATQIVFNELIFGNDNVAKSYGENAKEINTPAEEASFVMNNPNSIAAVSLAFATDNHGIVAVNGVAPDHSTIQNGSYMLSRPLNLVTPGKPTTEVTEFVKFMLTPEAQAIVGKHFVPAKK